MHYIQIAGHLGKDPETRYTQDGKKVTSFSVAINKRKKGEDITLWYRVTIWGDQFDKMLPYMKKGSAVMVVGDLDTGIYTDKEGRPQVSREITAWNISFSPFGKGNSQENGAPTSSYGQNSAPSQPEPMRGSYTSQPQDESSYEEEDALPF
ncbi:MAG: single-stranded DNA-binding protein [Chlamydiia bacterium]|nr:single-stranded DNA-binding protein [Chlamydiia bacterium]